MCIRDRYRAGQSEEGGRDWCSSRARGTVTPIGIHTSHTHCGPDCESMADSHWRRRCSHLYWFGLCMEHAEPADSGSLSGSALVVQSSLHDILDSPCASRPERGVRWTVGGTQR